MVFCALGLGFRDIRIKMSKYTKQQKLDWLQKVLDRSCLLQVNHPHLAWYPTEEDRVIYREIINDIENSNGD